MIKCVKCGEWKSRDEFHNSKNSTDGKTERCKECSLKSAKKYYEEHRESCKENAKKRRRERGVKSMHENKECSAYLGIVIGERLCRHIFKDVEVMPYGHPGYDIICNRGKKIDVKTATYHGNWQFTIKKNKVPDYFIFVAFDNIEDLNAQHMWMIPGDEVNGKQITSIKPSSIHKWDKWKRDINEIQMCCTKLKINNGSDIR